jgi:hypothetical protein
MEELKVRARGNSNDIDPLLTLLSQIKEIWEE